MSSLLAWVCFVQKIETDFVLVVSSSSWCHVCAHDEDSKKESQLLLVLVRPTTQMRSIFWDTFDSFLLFFFWVLFSLPVPPCQPRPDCVDVEDFVFFSIYFVRRIPTKEQLCVCVGCFAVVDPSAKDPVYYPPWQAGQQTQHTRVVRRRQRPPILARRSQS